MAIFESKLDANGEAFQSNRKDMLGRIAALREIEAKVRASEESKRPKFEKRGQLLPRERVQRLLDANHDPEFAALLHASAIARLAPVGPDHCSVVRTAMDRLESSRSHATSPSITSDDPAGQVT